MAKMTVSISPNGEIKVQIEGIKGKSCVELTKEFEEALGEVINKKFTSEYYQEGFIKSPNLIKEKK